MASGVCASYRVGGHIINAAENLFEISQDLPVD
jgi:hypothetical protein